MTKGRERERPPITLGQKRKTCIYYYTGFYCISSLRNYLQVVVDQTRYAILHHHVLLSFVHDFLMPSSFFSLLIPRPVLDGDCNHNEIRRWALSSIGTPFSLDPVLSSSAYILQWLSPNICAVDFLSDSFRRRKPKNRVVAALEINNRVFFFFFFFFLKVQKFDVQHLQGSEEEEKRDPSKQN